MEPFFNTCSVQLWVLRRERNEYSKDIVKNNSKFDLPCDVGDELRALRMLGKYSVTGIYP